MKALPALLLLNAVLLVAIVTRWARLTDAWERHAHALEMSERAASP
ncbi:MAG: hypothetical protein GY913_06805 [Proteobacteria bacterium]|nr:hypothetical protein [Pseudomonadota bacterium]MCP4916616.1 hypothetical protein [Pseudomonadota bacterium]